MIRSIIIMISLLSALVLPTLVASTVEGSGAVIGSVTVALTISDVSVSDIGYYRATINWKTNGNATSQVFYDTVSHDNVTDYRYYTSEDITLVSVHSVTLTGLSSSTTYHYRARSRIPGTDFIAVSNDYIFTTLSPPEVGAPPPPPPAPPPGTTDVTALVTTTGIFTEKVVAESFDTRCHLTIDKDTKGLTEEGRPLRQITMVEMKVSLPPPADSHTIGLTYDFGPAGATFDPPVTLTISYDPLLLPEGVAEKDLVITYYDEGIGKWVELDSVVDTKANTISAKVSHFTAFAIFGYKAVAPPVRPAAFTVSNLSILPDRVYIGERVTISVIVANTGGEAGSYSVTLKINDVVEATQEVTVSAGRSKEVTFSTARDIPGIYAVTVDGLSGSFTVVAPLLPPPPTPAAFSVTNLSIQPTQVQPKEVVTITMLVSNTGGTERSYTVVLKINGVTEAEKAVTIAPGQTETVSFRVTRDEPGEYAVDVDGLRGSFAVVVPPKPLVNWPLVGAIIGAVVVLGLVIFLVLRRRRRAY